jgi:hypothetical protein
MPIVNKKVKLELVGIDGNCFAIMGAFQRQARKENWTPEEINLVLEEAQKDDYNHLLRTIREHCESPKKEKNGYVPSWIFEKAPRKIKEKMP